MKALKSVLLSLTLMLCAPPIWANEALRGTTAQGDLPGPGAAGVYVLRSPQQWQAFQNKARVNWNADIDFGRDMVIAVVLDTRTTGGYRIDLTEMRVEGGLTTVTYTEIPPAATAPVIQTLTHPYVMSVVQQAQTPVVFSKGHFGAVEVPYEEYVRLTRHISELSYQLEDERRQKALAEGRVRDLVDLMARNGQN